MLLNKPTYSPGMQTHSDNRQRDRGSLLKTTALKALLTAALLLVAGYPALAGQQAGFSPATFASAERVGQPGKHPIQVSADHQPALYSLDDHRTAFLSRTVSVQFDGVTVAEALREVTQKAGLQLSYGSDAVAVDKVIRLRYDDAPIRQVLQDIVKDTNLGLLISRSGHVVVRTRAVEAAVQPMSVGALRTASGRAQMPTASLPVAAVITGRITDATSAEPLPGANVVIVGTQMGAMADGEGRYEIVGVPAGTYSLRATFIGYAEQVRESVEVRDNGSAMVNFSLEPSMEMLDDLVVVGYGTQRRRDLTGAVSSVTAEVLENSVTSTVDELLQGRVAGVVVTQNSGAPGGGISLNIRGISTLNGDTEPLYVVDGVPISGSVASSSNSSGQGQKMTNALATLNPQDIESMEILKDASATAIYGARAANGVVLITTKRGRPGESQLAYDGYYGVQQLPQRVETMDLQTFARFQNDRAASLGLTAPAEFADPSLLGTGTDWQDVLFRAAPMQNHNLRMSGGNDRTQYMLSAGIFNQEGIATASWFRRYSARLNLDNQATSWARVGTSLNLSRTRERINVANENLINLAVRQRPDIPLRAADGTWGGPSQAQFTLQNPVGMAEITENYRGRNQLLGNIYADLKFFKNLSLRSEFDGNLEFTKDDQFMPTYRFGALVNNINTSNRSTGTNTYWMVKNYLTFQDDLTRGLNLTAMVGHEAQEWAWDGLYGSRQNFPSNTVQELNTGDPETDNNGSYAGGDALESYFGRVNLNIGDRYLLTTTMRADGSSKFGENNRWGYFPSFSAAWVPTEERFLRGALRTARIEDMKVRFGYGQVGNQNIGSYSYGATLAAWATPWGAGFLPSGLGNPDLKWETTEAYNGGLDLALFNQRVRLTADAYLKNTRDLLLRLPLPPHAGTSGEGGFASPYVNIGAIKNRGLEFNLSTINLTGPVVWNTDVVFSTNKNEVTRMNSESSVIDRGVSRTVVGGPVGRFYGYVVEGVFTDAEDLHNSALPVNLPVDPNGIWIGDFKFKDVNGDGVITEQDRTFIGNPQPDFTYGVTNSFYFKNWQFSVFLNGKYGNEIFNDIRRINEDPNTNFGLLENANDFARLELVDPNGSINDVENVYVSNPETMVPRLSLSGANNNYRVSDVFVEDGSYLRVKNVTLGYNLTNTAANYFRLQQMRVYLRVENLLTLTGYSGYDPEVGSNQQDALQSGIDSGRYPSARTYTIGINVGF